MAGMRTSTITLLFALAAIALTGACSHSPAPAPQEGPTFIVVRHAEKADDSAKDPPLSEKGLKRAASLADVLSGSRVDAVYATGYQRTQQTAAPTATAQQVPVNGYDARQPADEFVAQLLVAHPSGQVLIVGHSNTVPGIVSALSGQPVEPMSDDEYGLIHFVRPQDPPGSRIRIQRY